ncbi:hypothetical protein DM02DRAFT_678654 [Periconia macrospinosa]|uniref:Uncharacterized protein n=1 Tax=Periconia macrospinosa TaxID=97972 RepID=A0A2V1CYW2_9PLEO|nr:hypothetical protein DM02DRAFT_678654 [Periconia macrospinosa]
MERPRSLSKRPRIGCDEPITPTQCASVASAYLLLLRIRHCRPVSGTGCRMNTFRFVGGRTGVGSEVQGVAAVRPD